jgi:hypothetical protein
MTIGPEPIRRIFRRSVRFGIGPERYARATRATGTVMRFIERSSERRLCRRNDGGASGGSSETHPTI